MAFDVIEGMDDVNSLNERFNILESLGFEVIYRIKTGNMGMEETPDIISMVHKYADDNGGTRYRSLYSPRAQRAQD